MVTRLIALAGLLALAAFIWLCPPGGLLVLAQALLLLALIRSDNAKREAVRNATRRSA